MIFVWAIINLIKVFCFEASADMLAFTAVNSIQQVSVRRKSWMQSSNET